ncbi:ABC-three component system protein [Neobacillus mesonae]|uniref:ABC-three component system protein n=1 Tax=Neobacillus mesonae TaxID=1193713 RepID=UPI00257423CB|nr:ABC-three component system protein [Neobacillus mesonae]
MSSKFSAGGSAIGYIYQVRYALYLIMKDENLEKEVSIERLDDVSFEKSGTPTELFQLKHHINKSATLTNGCSDLWKTIRVWSDAVKKKQIQLPGVMFSLITTGTAPKDSAPYFLKADINRNPDKARDILLSFISTSQSETNRVNYDSFLSLTNEEQIELLRAIYIMDNSPNILDVSELIKNRLKLTTRRNFLDPLYQRVEGWWFNRILNHLIENSISFVSGYEVQDIINDFAEQLRPDSLPIDYYDATPNSDSSTVNENMIFVEQLRLLNLNNKTIEFSMRDYYRAFIQRSRWAKDELLFVGELQRYENRLLEEWERQFNRINRSSITVIEEVFIERGLELFDWMNDSQIHIRRNCTEPYVMRGSFHMLANKKSLCLGWHPNFKERISILLESYKEKSI